MEWVAVALVVWVATFVLLRRWLGREGDEGYDRRLALMAGAAFAALLGAVVYGVAAEDWIVVGGAALLAVVLAVKLWRYRAASAG